MLALSLQEDLKPCFRQGCHARSDCTEAWSCVLCQPLHHGVCHCGVALSHHQSAQLAQRAPSLDLSAMSPNPPVKNGDGTGNRLVWCDSQDLSQTLPHAGIMTMREGSREVRSNTPQPIIRHTSAKTTKRPVDLPQLGCVQTESTVPPVFVLRSSARTRAVQQEPRGFSPLAGKLAETRPLSHTTASGLALRAALVRMSIPRGGTPALFHT